MVNFWVLASVFVVFSVALSAVPGTAQNVVAEREISPKLDIYSAISRIVTLKFVSDLDLGGFDLVNVGRLQAFNVTAVNYENVTNLAVNNSQYLRDEYPVSSSAIGTGAVTDSKITSMDWTKLISFPTACTAAQAVTGIGATITCSAISITRSQISDFWTFNSTYDSHVLSDADTSATNEVPLAGSLVKVEDRVVSVTVPNCGATQVLTNRTGTLTCVAGGEGGGADVKSGLVTMELDSCSFVSFNTSFSAAPYVVGTTVNGTPDSLVKVENVSTGGFSLCLKSV